MSRRVDVDVAEIKRLYFAEGLNAERVGLEVGCSPNTVRRRIGELGITPRAPGKPVKYPPVEIGKCGTPGCADPDCAIPFGRCHCGCGQQTPIAGRHDRRHRRIKGQPCRFILGHDVLSDEGRRIQSANMTAMRTNGGVIFTARVAYGRHGSTRLFGRANRELATAKGTKVGPAFTRVDAAKAERILRLADEKKANGKPRHSQRTIARLVGVSRGSVENVLRNRRGVVSHFSLDELA